MSDRPPEPSANPADHRVVILGAGPKAERYANRAQRLLLAGGYPVVPVQMVS